MLQVATLLVVLAHPGQGPPVAWPDLPHDVAERADDTYTFTWTDSDLVVATGTATIDWFYTAANPPTYQPGLVPDGLEGTLIVGGIPEADLTNSYTWDTSAVPAGAYFLWSRVNEPASERPLLRVIAFSRGVLVVAHPGDELHPAVAITRPDSPFHIAEGDFELKWEAFDPDGSALVTLEATTSSVGEDFVVLADQITATSSGTFVWRTSEYAEGNWTLRASIRDGRGLSFIAYSRYFLRIEHPFAFDDAGGGGLDGGAAGDGGPGRRFADGAAYDGGTGPVTPPSSCACAHRSPGGGGALLGVLALVLLRRRSGVCCRCS